MSYSLDDLRQVVEKHWGYHTFRPLQEMAMRAVLEGRDSVVVMPTGGGKSLCYQAPAVLRGGTTVVISPLISLMKDQVDGLRSCGVPAIQIDSSLSQEERFISEMDVRQGAVRLLFVSPERLTSPDFCNLLRAADVRTFAIDEAHCISHWGHDFRPEYRMMARIKELFPQASVHAYTATATEQVRADIVKQLKLSKPDVLVGNFDRPNLNYRVLPRQNLETQVLQVIERHKGEAGIIYCIRRRDVDDLADFLKKKKKLKVLPYHAGLSADVRNKTQDEFAAERCDLIVATVAFGMGIDRSNIRFVLHSAMPKSIEHYQQETGRAGRDGLEAECVLLYSGADYFSWQSIIQKSYEESQADPAVMKSVLKHVSDMERYCREMVCRHRALVAYFGQKYEHPRCNACDVCLGDTEPVPDALIVAQKILSCVARMKEGFGAAQVIAVLRGENNARVRNLGHDKLSTFGLLRDCNQQELQNLIAQLVSQEILVQEAVDVGGGRKGAVLKLNPASWEVMRGKRDVRLRRPVRHTPETITKSEADKVSWEGVDRELFEKMRVLRKQFAEKANVPPFVVFSDAVLRELARVRPSTRDIMHGISGVGERKLNDYGDGFIDLILQHCQESGAALDVASTTQKPAPPQPRTKRGSAEKELALRLFKHGESIDQVCELSERARGTVIEYLCEFIEREKPESIASWVADEAYEKVKSAVAQIGSERLKPIWSYLEEKVTYDDIRIVLAHLHARHS